VKFEARKLLKVHTTARKMPLSLPGILQERKKAGKRLTAILLSNGASAGRWGDLQR